MKLRHLGVVALVWLWATGCSSGSTDRVTTPYCGPESTFCLISCNLGCSTSGGCAITEIAQNQPIELHFSDLLDPASVTAGAISLKTRSGESPAGQFVATDSALVFVPEIRVSSGATRFGFRAGETYVLNLSASPTGPTLQSRSGDRLARPVVCSLSVTQGLVDLDGEAPSAELIVPSPTVDVPTDTQIILRFSELINISRFLGGNTQTSPIIYQIRKTIEDPANPGVQICNPQFNPVLIQGIPVASVVAGQPPQTEIALQPAIELPADVCIEVIVTDQILDLSGRPAERQTFHFFTEAGDPVPKTITETFATEQGMDRRISGGIWSGGRAIAPRFGGSGRLGSFEHVVGRNEPSGSSTFVFDTDSQVFPGDGTLFGESIEVTDGVFEFTDFVVPDGIRVVFRGSNPAVIRVRGQYVIEGAIGVDGEAPSSSFDGRSSPGTVGQIGTPNPGESARGGGAGGGDGGRGGQGCPGDGATAAMRGAAGEDCVAPASSGYAGQVTGSGGNGGDVFPANGLRTSVVYNLFFSISGQVSGGGGGGSFLGVGEAGRVIRTFTSNNPIDIGPGATAGTQVPFLALPAGTSSLDHFLVGGSGGGGGGSHPLNMTTTQVNGTPTIGPTPFHGGGSGGGGGGALALRLGYDFTATAAGILSCRGGGGAQHLTQGTGPPPPGGGGSGGSILIQLEQASRFNQGGTMDVSGGTGTFLEHRQFNNAFVTAEGGDGGHGFVRLEGAGASAASLGNVVGPAAVTSDNFGELAADEGDTQSGCTSIWHSTRKLFPPEFLHYQMTIRVNGQQQIYSDNPDELNPANRNDIPVRVYVQGGEVNPGSGQLEGDPGPWRDFVSGHNGQSSINDDGATGFRFMLIFNRDIATDVAVEEFQVTYRG